jgi:ATP-binding cassette, subfamily B, bacterial
VDANALTRKEALRRGFGLLWRTHRRAVSVLIVLSVTDAAVLGAGVVLLRNALDHLFTGRSFWLAALPLVALVSVQQASAAIRETVETLVRQETATEVDMMVLARVGDVPFESISDNEWQGGVGLVLREASYRPGALVDNGVSTMTVAATLIGLFTGAVAVLGPAVLLLPLVAAPALVVESRLRVRLIDVQTAAAPLLLRMQLLSQMSIDADWQRDVRAAGSPILEVEYRRLARQYLRRLRAVVTGIALRRGLAGLVVAAVLVLGALGLTDRIADGRTPDPSTVAVLLGVLAIASRNVSSLVFNAGELISSAEYLRILFSFLDAPRPADGAAAPATTIGETIPGATLDQTVTGQAVAGEEPGGRDGATAAGPGPGAAIVLREVSYTYPGRDRPALDRVSATLPPGLTAVSGPNGAGKTTLVKILAGLLLPRSGSITVVSPGRRDRPWGSLRRAVLFQNSSHLRLTVRQNVTLTAAGGDDVAVRAALEAAGLRAVVDALPDGLDTVLGAGFGGATDLSGGQWQRLALARLYHADAPVVICDEPSTGLDARGEADLMERLREMARDRFVFIVTHRSETIAACDRALLFDLGRLLWDGEPDGAIDRLSWSAPPRPLAARDPSPYPAGTPTGTNGTVGGQRGRS